MPTSPSPRPQSAVTAAASALRAEQMRADLAAFYGTRLRGIPLAMDFIQAMHMSKTGDDFPDNAVQLHLDLTARIAARLDQAQVWVATTALADAITGHDLVTSSDGYLLQNADEAPAPVGLLVFPVPVTGASDLPIHGLAWDVEGTGDELQLNVTALTDTRALYDALPPALLPNERSKTPTTANALILAVPQISMTIQSYGHAPYWGAAPASILVGMLLAFWDLRPAYEHDEAPVATKVRAGRKKRVKFRPVRVIRESATRFSGEPTPSEADRRWAEETLRWTVAERWSWRCPNPHHHKAIIEAGGTCPKVKVRITEHVNGPLGRGIDTRRAVRIATTRPADQL